MNRENLTTYLKDHYAGSFAAVELIDRLITATKDTHHCPFFLKLKSDVQADQEVLRTLFDHLGSEDSSVRNAAAWIVEKMAQVKLKFDGPIEAAMGRLQALEALLLGITGKRALWLALKAGMEPVMEIDFHRLIQNAENQLRAVEEKRVEAARDAFSF